ncbi:MAG: c-type cytochrome [Planctomycetota bacterium]
MRPVPDRHPLLRASKLLLFAAVSLSLPGCSGRGDSFTPVAATLDLSPDAQMAVAGWVAEAFGTPSLPSPHPVLPITWGATTEVETAEEARPVSETLRRGRALYAAQCIQCHGVDGAGDGATASALNPRPRDFRLGIFKYTSTGPAEKARRRDIERTLRGGLAGTAMPRYPAVPKEDLDAVIEYVRWLAMRGECETGVAFDLAYASDIGGDEIDAAVDESGERSIGRVASRWVAAEQADAVVRAEAERPAMTAESIARGEALFRSGPTSCVSCHGTGGRGDGPELDLPHAVPSEAAGTKRPGLWDAWGRRVRPRDLTKGIYRGGGDPTDLFRRIKVGVKGTPMPGAGGRLGDDEIWDLVNYVISLAE